MRAPSCYQMVTIDECKYIKATQQRSYKKKIKFISLGKLNLLYFFHDNVQPFLKLQNKPPATVVEKIEQLAS